MKGNLYTGPKYRRKISIGNLKETVLRLALIVGFRNVSDCRLSALILEVWMCVTVIFVIIDIPQDIFKEIFAVLHLSPDLIVCS